MSTKGTRGHQRRRLDEVRQSLTHLPHTLLLSHNPSGPTSSFFFSFSTHFKSHMTSHNHSSLLRSIKCMRWLYVCTWTGFYQCCFTSIALQTHTHTHTFLATVQVTFACARAYTVRVSDWQLIHTQMLVNQRRGLTSGVQACVLSPTQTRALSNPMT